MRFRQTSQKARLHIKLARQSEPSYLFCNFQRKRSSVKRACTLFAVAFCVCLLSLPTRAQQTNPVDRKVENPITDTPYVNPLQQDQPVRPVSTGKVPPIQAGDQLDVSCVRESFSGPKEA